MKWRILLTKQALKDLNKLRSSGLSKKAKNLVDLLETNPYTNPPAYDDGGPFTTDESGNVYDRWGNEIWHNPVTHNDSIGYNFVPTSDR